MTRPLAWIVCLGTLLCVARARAEEPPPSGAAVVALGEAARPHAKDQARVVYRKPELRPNLEESVARVLIGDPPPEGDARAAAIAAVTRAAGEASEEPVRRSLLGQPGR